MNWITQTLRALAPNCREAIRLQSAALDQPQPLLRRIGLRIHLVLCVWCARYGRQIKFLRSAAQCCEEHAESGPVLSAEARQQIKRAIAAQK